jgi:hypothetical protein
MGDTKLTSKQKLDELLGITDSSSIDDFLNDLTIDTEEIATTFQTINDKVQENVEKIESNINIIQTNGIQQDSFLNIKSVDASLKEIEDLITLSKQMFKHVYTSIVSTDLVDSELISSAAKLLESIHVNISEFLSVYKEKQRFADKIKLMVFQQEQKKELLELKHKHDIEKLKMKPDAAAPLDLENMANFSQEQIIKMIN